MAEKMSGSPLPDLSGRRAALFGGGEILDDGAVQELLRPDDVILCADSGYDHCVRMGLSPRLLVGDLDSVRAKRDPAIPVIPFPAEKDYTDLTHAMEIALGAGCREMLLAGVLGGRLDHTMGNLQNLYRLSRAGVSATLTDGRTDVFAVTDGELILPHRPGHYFSVFALSDRAEQVAIRDAKYLLDNYTLTADVPRGVSNEFLDRPARISVGAGTLAVFRLPMD